MLRAFLALTICLALIATQQKIAVFNSSSQSQASHHLKISKQVLKGILEEPSEETDSAHPLQTSSLFSLERTPTSQLLKAKQLLFQGCSWFLKNIFVRGPP